MGSQLKPKYMKKLCEACDTVSAHTGRDLTTSPHGTSESFGFFAGAAGAVAGAVVVAAATGAAVAVPRARAGSEAPSTAHSAARTTPHAPKATKTNSQPYSAMSGGATR